MTPIVSISNVSKTYDGGGEALKNVSLDIQEGEIIALLGPNGAGKTTLISAICGLTSLTSGSITVGGYDIIKDYRKTRSLIGLVPQEISIEPFQTVTHALTYSRGLFGRPSNAQYIENLLKKLSLWDKAKSKVMELSGGMKRRVLIGKALSHEPRVLFLDEPTAGVDVELRKDMWDVIAELKADGVTIILTTHYIEEAEEMADRSIEDLADEAAGMKRQALYRQVQRKAWADIRRDALRWRTLEESALLPIGEAAERIGYGQV